MSAGELAPPVAGIVALEVSRDALVTELDGSVRSVFQENTYAIRATRADGAHIVRVLEPGARGWPADRIAEELADLIAELAAEAGP